MVVVRLSHFGEMAVTFDKIYLSFNIQLEQRNGIACIMLHHKQYYYIYILYILKVYIYIIII